MAYDRYDTRDDQARWRDSRDRNYETGRRDDRGFFERAGDEIASWFGDERSDRPRDDRDRSDRDWRDRSGQSSSFEAQGNGYRSDRARNFDREDGNRGSTWPSSDRDYNPSWRSELGSDRSEWRERDRGRGSESSYRPMTGNYGASDWDRDRSDRDRLNRSEWGRDDYRNTSRAGTRDQSDRSRHFDPHYHSWREQHMNELDRDYDDYRRENQSKFDNDFSSWRDRRGQKRGLLGQIREHMEVVGNDDEHVGTVDKTAGDRIILTKSDPESGDTHHSISCAQIDRVEGERVILDCSADKARENWRDENRSRALFEREDSGEMGSHTLNRAFEGTYR